MQVAIDVVLDHGDAAGGSQCGQPPLVLVGHHATKRIAAVRDDQAGSDSPLPAGQIERLDRHAGARVARNLQGAQPEGLQQLQHQVVSRRFDGHGVTGSGDRPQAETERFGAGIGDDDLVSVQRPTPRQ